MRTIIIINDGCCCCGFGSSSSSSSLFDHRRTPSTCAVCVRVYIILENHRYDCGCYANVFARMWIHKMKIMFFGEFILREQVRQSGALCAVGPVCYACGETFNVTWWECDFILTIISIDKLLCVEVDGDNLVNGSRFASWDDLWIESKSSDHCFPPSLPLALFTVHEMPRIEFFKNILHEIKWTDRQADVRFTQNVEYENRKSI